MPFTADQIADINATSLELYMDRGTVFKQNVANKPMLQAFDAAAGSFVGNNDRISIRVKAGQGGGSLAGYTGDDQLSYYNPTGIKQAGWSWKEHFIGMVLTMTELKKNGIDVKENGSSQSTSVMSNAEQVQLANLLDEKNDELGEDYAYSLDRLVHGDGTSDTKALAGIASLILENPLSGSTGGLSRASNSWWRNDACTAAAYAAGGLNKITSSAASGGALIEAMDKAVRRRTKYANGGTRVRYFAGSDFIDAYRLEMRANGSYTQTGWTGKTPDGSMSNPAHGGIDLEWDPTMDDLGKSKFCYAIDMGRRGVRLLYMDGNRMKKHNPARPYDRMVMYNGISTTAAMIAKQLNTSGIYEIN